MPKKKALAKKRPKYNLKSRITSALRRIWFYGPERKIAAKLAKERGTCALCKESAEKLEIDHIVPVVPVTGFDNWELYIQRLFVEAPGLRGICSACHAVVTSISRKQRKDNKNS